MTDSRFPEQLDRPAYAAAEAGRLVVWSVLFVVAVTARAPLGALQSNDALDVVELAAAELQEGYGAGNYTVVEVTQAFLNRIERYEDHYNAFISMNPDAHAWRSPPRSTRSCARPGHGGRCTGYRW